MKKERKCMMHVCIHDGTSPPFLGAGILEKCHLSPKNNTFHIIINTTIKSKMLQRQRHIWFINSWKKKSLLLCVNVVNLEPAESKSSKFTTTMTNLD
jgi:hypothetical protein